MGNEFDTICEDNSLEEIGDKLCHFYQCIKSGKIEMVANELTEMQGSGAPHSVSEAVAVGQDEDDDDDEEAQKAKYFNGDHEKNRRSRNDPDEDGWITIRKGNK